MLVGVGDSGNGVLFGAGVVVAVTVLVAIADQKPLVNVSSPSVKVPALGCPMMTRTAYSVPRLVPPTPCTVHQSTQYSLSQERVCAVTTVVVPTSSSRSRISSVIRLMCTFTVMRAI